MTDVLLLPAVVVTAVVVLGLAVFVRRAIVISHDRERHWGCLDGAGIQRGLQMLLRRGYNGAFAVVTDRPSGRFVQFRKYISAPGDVGLEMHFPRTEWSEAYYLAVQTTLRNHGVSFERVALHTAPTVEVIQADFGRDDTLAARVTSEIMLAVFKLPTLSVELKAEDLCPLEQFVDRTDHPRPAALLFDRVRHWTKRSTR